MGESPYDRAEEAAAVLRSRTTLRPRIALVLGSGLGAFADSLEEATAIPYEQIPHFPVSTAVGHAGRLVVGRCRDVPVLVMQGRAHSYEGYTLEQVTFPVRVLGRCGIRALIVTNAAGGINRKLRVPALLVIRDHVNFLGANPLRGPNDERFGTRFPDMTEAYSKRLRALAKKHARKLKITLPEGIYVAFPGPSYETPAEIKAMARWGVDVVGMSTVPEVIVANHMGIEVLGLSSVSNLAAGLSGKKVNHDEVLAMGERLGGQLTALLRSLLPELARMVA
ncbi:MAG: purine-nucleoside phosphorylase [Terriglobia bacterium]